MGRIFLFWLMIVAVSAKPDPQHLTEQYQYQRSYSQQSSGGGYGGADFQRQAHLDSSSWVQQHQTEVRRVAEKLRSEFNAAVGQQGGGGGTHYQRYVSRVTSGTPPDCDTTFHGSYTQKQLDSWAKTMTQQLIEDLRTGRVSSTQFHQPQFFFNRAAEKLEEANHVAPAVSGHSYYKKVVESENSQPPPVISRGHSSRFREEYSRTYQPPPPPPVQSHYSRHYEERRVVPPVPIQTSSSQFSKRVEEERRVVPPPVQTSSQYSKRVEEERRVVPPPVQTSSQYSKRVEEERRVVPPPQVTSSQYSRRVEQEERRVPPPQVSSQSRYSKRVEEERRVAPTPVTFHESRNFTSSQSQSHDLPTYKDSYFSSSLAERHRQHGHPRPFNHRYQKRVEEESVQQPQAPVVTSHQSRQEHRESHNQQVQQQVQQTHRKELQFARTVYPSWCHNNRDQVIFEQYYKQRVAPSEYGRKLTRNEKVEFEEYYSSQGGTTRHQRVEERHFNYPKWIVTQTDKAIFEEYFEQRIGDVNRVLTEREEEEFEEYYRQQGGTAVRERTSVQEEHQIQYPAWVVTTEQRKVFDEYYHAKVGQTQRQLNQYELREFEDYYRQHQAANSQRTEEAFRSTIELSYPSWVVTETDRKIFEEYYFSHVDVQEYGRELTRAERVNFETYYTQNGGTTKHEVESYSITYPAWIVTVEDRAIYDEYYLSVVGYEQYGRELTTQELKEFEEYYRTHSTQLQEIDLRAKITYPSWLVTEVDRVIYEDYYRITVAQVEWGRELSTTELESFYTYYQQRGGKSRAIIEAALFARLSYPSWLGGESDRQLFREFYLRRVEVEEYGRELTTEELEQFREYYVRHRYGRYEQVNGHTDFQWVYPSWAVTRADRRVFDAYYSQVIEREEWGRELSESEKIEFQQFFVERGGLYEYRYARDEYLLSFTLDRSSGGSAYQWTWDGVERISDKKVHELSRSQDAHHTDDYDRKVYGTTREEEPLPPPPPTNNDNVIRPQKTTISKDRGDQPPQVYEETEAEPGVGEYVPPEVEVLPTVRPLEPGPRPEPPRQTLVQAPSGGTTEYRRRYEHKIVSSRVVPGDVYSVGSASSSVSGTVDVDGRAHNTNNIHRRVEEEATADAEEETHQSGNTYESGYAYESERAREDHSQTGYEDSRREESRYEDSGRHEEESRYEDSRRHEEEESGYEDSRRHEEESRTHEESRYEDSGRHEEESRYDDSRRQEEEQESGYDDSRRREEESRYEDSNRAQESHHEEDSETRHESTGHSYSAGYEESGRTQHESEGGNYETEDADEKREEESAYQRTLEAEREQEESGRRGSSTSYSYHVESAGPEQHSSSSSSTSHQQSHNWSSSGSYDTQEPDQEQEEDERQIEEREREEERRYQEAEEQRRREERERQQREEQRRVEERERQEREEQRRREEQERYEAEENENREGEDGNEREEDDQDQEAGDEREEQEEEEYEEVPPDDYINDQRRRNYRSHRGEVPASNPRAVSRTHDGEQEVPALVQEIPSGNEVTEEKPGLWNRMKSKAKVLFG